MVKIREEIGLTFDDVLLVPRESKVLPRETDVSTKLTNRISIAIPIVSAAMDTVTESDMAIALAQEGGIGIIHKNLTPKDQAQEVRRVKLFESKIIQKPVTLFPQDTLGDAKAKMEKYGITGFPVVDVNRKLVGILTKKDMRLETNLKKKVSQLMPKRKVVTGRVGVSTEEAKKILQRRRIEKLPIVDDQGFLKGLITMKDIEKSEHTPWASKDDNGRLRVGAAVGVGKDMLERARAVVNAGCDVLVVDTAHAHHKMVLDGAAKLRQEFPDIDLIVGNVATKEATKALCEIGVNAVKVGIGPGSICTTRIIAGIGIPQLTAIMDCAEESNVPIIADGGIRWSGDIVKALAAGASTVMLGSILAGTKETPGETILFEGRRYKQYRAMGSIEAMKQGSADRYFQEEAKKLVPEGVEARVPYRGPVSEVLLQFIGGLRSGMGYCGAKTIRKLQERAEFARITSAGVRENHPHDVTITKESPNYGVSHERGHHG